MHSGDRQIALLAGLAERVIQLVVRQAAHIIEVDAVGTVIGAVDICPGPVRGLAQVVQRIAVLKSSGQSCCAAAVARYSSAAPSSISSRHSLSG